MDLTDSTLPRGMVFAIRTKRLLRRVGLITVIAAGVVVLTWGLERFLAKSSGEWTDALQVTITVVLVVVTTKYVTLTERLAKGQESTIRRSTQEVAVKEASRLAADLRESIRRLLVQTDLLRDSELEQPQDLRKVVARELHQVLIAQKRLDQLAPELPPDLRREAAVTSWGLGAATWMFGELLRALSLELETAAAEGRQPTMASIRKNYEAKLHPEAWTELLAADDLKSVWEQTNSLSDSLRDYLSE